MNFRQQVFRNKKYLYSTIAIVALVAYSTIVYGAQLAAGTPPPTGGYLAGDSIMDPGCAPNTPNCFQNVGSGVAGLNTDIQFNDNGSLGASDNLSWNKTTKVFSVGDIDGSSNGTVFSVDDSHSRYVFSKPNFLIDNIAYAFPGSQGNAGDVLTNDGSGNLSWAPAGATDWSLSGNSGTDGGVNDYIGTSDAEDFVVKTDGAEVARFYSDAYGSPSRYSVALGGGEADSISVFSAGAGAGAGATNTDDANFIGSSAGSVATGSQASNFMGEDAGASAVNADNSNFFGTLAGADTTNDNNSNFLGQYAGNGTSNADHSNFLGYLAGLQASGASHSTFIGDSAGSNTTNAANAIFIGSSAGNGDTVDNSSGGTSILIGDSTSTGGFSNSIALGANAENTASNQFMVGSSYTDWNIAGVDYVWPSSQAGAAGDVLTNDGSGNLTWAPASAAGIDDVLAQGQALTTGRSIDINGNAFSISDSQGYSDGLFYIGGGSAQLGDYNDDANGTYIDVDDPDQETDITSLVTKLLVSSSGTPDELRFYSPTKQYVGISAPASGLATYHLVWPAAQGNAGDVLTNDGSGNLSWAPASGGGGGGTSGLIGSTSGVTSSPTPGSTNETWLGVNAGTNGGSTDYTTFLGINAGDGATNVSYSQFIGSYAGAGATNANSSTFIGYSTGYNATNASASFFVGDYAGQDADYASNSQFIGESAGDTATYAYNSAFIGRGAGEGATYATRSNIFGDYAGVQAGTSSDYDGDNIGSQYFNANFLGAYAGYAASDAHDSNFLGQYSGFTAVHADDSNFFGKNAGYTATNAAHSIFIGYDAGLNDAVDNVTTPGTSILIGDNTSTGGFSNSIALGANAVNTMSNQFSVASSYNNWDIAGVNYVWPSSQAAASGYVLTNDGTGNLTWAPAGGGGGASGWSLTGNSGTDGGTTNFIGTTDDQDFVVKADSFELGRFYASRTGGSPYPENGSVAFGGGEATGTYSFVFGGAAGAGSTAISSIIMGRLAGQNSNDNGALLLGIRSGQNTTGYVRNSSFIGNAAGEGADSVQDSNFIGTNAGEDATNMEGVDYWNNSTSVPGSSNFIGFSAGEGSDGAGLSNFMGYQAGYQSTNADDSTFIGTNAGANSTDVQNAIFIGSEAGEGDTTSGSTEASYSILIGNASSTGGNLDSIALGAYAANTDTNQLMIGSTNYPINSIVMNGGGNQGCTIVTSGLSCSSDERLKTNITDLSSDELDTLDKVRTVTFNWDTDPNGSQNIGFLAQDIQQYYPQLVSTGPNGYLQVNYANMAPVLVESIRELNLKLTNIQQFATATDTTFLTEIENWLASATNGISNIFSQKVTTNQLCIGTTCISQSDLDAFKAWEATQGQSASSGGGGVPSVPSGDTGPSSGAPTSPGTASDTGPSTGTGTTPDPSSGSAPVIPLAPDPSTAPAPAVTPDLAPDPTVIPDPTPTVTPSPAVAPDPSSDPAPVDSSS